MHPLLNCCRRPLGDEVFVRQLAMVTIRPVRPEDHAAICRHRYRMFAENDASVEALDAMREPFAAWLAPRLQDGRYFGFVAEENGAVAAGIGMILLDWPPHFLHPESAVRGYVLNVYVEAEYRGRGLAKQLMELAEEEFRRRGVVFAVLHASAMGRPVYEGLGWSEMPEMGKAL
jgi:ribosomal protein S18 acetylase RimI-like enzyme